MSDGATAQTYTPGIDYMGGASRQQDPTMKWQLDPAEMLEELEMRLKGMEVNSTTGNWDPSEGVKFMNAKGVSSIMSTIKMNTGKFFLLSNVTKDEINTTMFHTMCSISTMIRCKYQEFEIDMQYFDIIYQTIENNLFFMMKASQDGFRVIQMGSTYQYHEMNSSQRDQQKSGFFSRLGGLFGWKGG